MKISVIGSGGWGTALSLLLVKNGHQVTLWSHSKTKDELLRTRRENPRLPGVKLPQELLLGSELDCAAEAEAVVIAVPSFAMRQTAGLLSGVLAPNTLVVSATKGIEHDTYLRMSSVIEDETGLNAVVLSGPSHAEEVALGQPTGCVAACRDLAAAERVQDIFMNQSFRVYVTDDVTGVELGGTLKNVIALCAGICDGLGYGDNTKALLMTRGLAEIARLGTHFGASPDTFTGLAGIGDLIVTCTSMHSRNRRAGILIGKGSDVRCAMDEVGSVVEGYFAARAAAELSRKAGVSMPIIEAAYRILYENSDPYSEVSALMNRRKRQEPEEFSWDGMGMNGV